MKYLALLFSAVFCFSSLQAEVRDSVVSVMEATPYAKAKLTLAQKERVEQALAREEESLRVMSFNMLLDWSEGHLDPIDRWESRGPRLIEYVKWVSPDLIGSQELTAGQTALVMESLKDEYGYFGPGGEDDDVPVVFYKKSRFELTEAESRLFSQEASNNYLVCHFNDLKTGQKFIFVDTHLAFRDMERRNREAAYLKEFLSSECEALPVVVTGDFNAFPHLPEEELPFYDGDEVVARIEEGGVRDARKLALLGHFGPLSSTNFCPIEKKPFLGEGTPGVMLDHIFVSDQVTVLRHAVDTARVDGHYPSDHFPLIADLLIED